MISTTVIVPARGGSKRIPNKNLIKIDGIPILEITLTKLLKYYPKLRIIVSTDSAEIMNLSKKIGVECLELRPEKLSGDYISTQEVVRYEIEKNQLDGFIFVVYPTSILIKENDIKDALDLLINSDFKFILSAFNPSANLFRSFKKNADGGCEMVYPENFKARSQDLPLLYCDAALFYLGEASSWINEEFSFNHSCGLIVVPQKRAIDLNNFDDLDLLRIVWSNQSE